MRGLEALEKVREMGGRSIIIGEILCLFAYIACPLILIPLEWWSYTIIDYVVTIIGVALHIITTDLDSGYWKVNFSNASWNKINFGG